MIYDEIESFKPSNSPEFGYPYEKRKTKIQELRIDWLPLDSETNPDWDPFNYNYDSEKIKFQISETCLEENYVDQVLFVHDFLQDLKAFIVGESNNEEEDSSCNNASFEKLKQIGGEITKKAYSDEYDPYVVEDKILFEIKMELDGFKTTNVRTSTQILDFLGDIGGFYQALDLIVFMLGQYFSSKFFVLSIAKKMHQIKMSQSTKCIIPTHKVASINDKRRDFLVGNSDKNYIEDEVAHPLPSESNLKISNFVKKRFHKIRFSVLNIIVDPIISSLCCPCYSCLKRAPFNVR